MKLRALHSYAIAFFTFYNFAAASAGIGFGDKQPIDNPTNDGYTAIAADFDNDGSIDVLTSSTQTMKWFKNDGKGRFTTHFEIGALPQNNLQIMAADLDNDGNTDIVFNNLYGNVEWRKNTGNGNFSAAIVLASNSNSYNMEIADIDGDGNLDIILPDFSFNRLLWFRNTGNAQFESAITIASDVVNPWMIKSADLNGDGNLDILTNSLTDSEIVWYPNLGNGNFGSKNVITTTLLDPELVYSVDMNLDGKMDIVSGSWADSRIVWFENLGNENFGIEQLITNQTQGLYAIDASDLDKDGDLDILTATVIGNKISYFENYNNETFGEQFIISTDVFAPHMIITDDLDGDFDEDVITASAYGQGVAWFSNTRDYVANGIVFFDVNQNGIQDNGEQGIGNQKVSIYPSNQLTTTHTQGNFHFTEERDTIYAIDWINDENWTLTTERASIDVQLPNNNPNPIAFGLFTQNTIHHLQPSITSLSSRCNNTVPFYFIIANEGTAIENAKAELIIEDNATIVNYQPSNLVVNGNRVTWDLNNLWPGNKQQASMNMAIPMPEFVGDSIKMTLNVYTVALDGTYTDTFTYRYASVISCAYDPNDKQVVPNGIDEPHYTLIDQRLYYTVRFQNVGNDYAYDVEVVDVLDANLDLSTLTIVSTSHTMRTKIEPETQKVQFIFEDIMLPDSARDEAGSHGYILYHIKPLANTVPYTRVENTAEIFFDQNPAIVTNTTYNTLVDVIPDSLAPTALCADTVTVYLNEDGYASLHSQQINLNSNDNIGIHQYQLDRANFSCSDIGLNEVQLSVYDYQYNSDQCSAIVRVADNSAPKLVCKTANFEIISDAPITIKPFDIIQELTDNCSQPNVVLSETEFTAADAGNQTIYITVEDESGNITHGITNINISIPTATDQLSSGTYITVHPNPFMEKASLIVKSPLGITIGDIDGGRINSYTVTIRDINGNIVREYLNVTQNQLEIERGNLSSGMYFVVVEFQNIDRTPELIKIILQ
jgi:uncharacterized repeat protein (TIGR01451 family)